MKIKNYLVLMLLFLDAGMMAQNNKEFFYERRTIDNDPGMGQNLPEK